MIHGRHLVYFNGIDAEKKTKGSELFGNMLEKLPSDTIYEKNNDELASPNNFGLSALHGTLYFTVNLVNLVVCRATWL